MNILHINSYYSKSKFYQNLFENQITKGIGVSVFVPVPYSFRKQDMEYGEYTRISASYSNLDRFFYFKKQNKIIKELEKKYDLNNYSLIHAHSLFTNGYVAMKMKEKHSVPYIVAVRNTDMNIFFKYMVHLRKIGIKILEEASQIIFLSSSYKEMLIDKYIPSKKKKDIYLKSNIIPNGIDDFWFRNKGSSKNKKEGTINMLFVGDINKNKNILTTIKAIRELQKSNYSVELTVVGEIISEKIYKNMKKASFVNYIPPLSKEALIEVYRSHDIFIMPSKYESFGLVYAEAMSQGTPVIYSKGQGFDNQFENGRIGYSVSYNKPDDIQKRIKDILLNYDDFSDACTKKSFRFNWNEITDKYCSLYKNVDQKFR